MENLKRQFAKELTPELRKETAHKLKETRKLPKTYKEIKETGTDFIDEYTDPEIEKIAEKMKKSIIGKWFNTWEYKELKASLEQRLKAERKRRVEKIKSGYEAEFEKILKQSPLTEKEQEKYLSEEAMVKMSLTDYLILLKRLSGNFVSHVTRYGIREQSFMYHERGKGEFFTSFTDVLKTKKLHSFFANFIENPTMYPNVRGFIENCIKNENLRGEKLVDYIASYYFGVSEFNMPADLHSVHVAVNNIAAVNYGAEKGYDFYFYFPAEFIAYNYYHYGRQEGEFEYSEQTGYDSYNDMGIWNKGKGIPVDAGITCIAGDVMVDRETGSKYKIVDDKPVLDNEGNPVLAENPVTSKDYWENYFTKNPEQRPSKVMYYEGGRFTTFGLGPEYQELWQKKRFGKTEDLPGYEKYVNETFNRFKEKIREIITSIEKKYNE